MREMTTREIQMVSLDILKDVHEFCEENNIKYTLQGGTLLGAIRHKGFIPWDDDIDIAMPRPDYDKFIHTYNNESGRYKLFSREIQELKDKVFMSYARVCDMESTLVDCKKSPWTTIPTGVWIDIFPLDGIEDSIVQGEKRVNKHYNLWKLCIKKRTLLVSYSSCTSIHEKAILFLKHVIYRFIPNDIFEKHIKLCREIPFGSTKHYCMYAFPGYKIRERHSIDVLDKVQLESFEDVYFYIMRGYKEALQEKFGDYMKLPPMELRVPGHGFFTYFWK